MFGSIFKTKSKSSVNELCSDVAESFSESSYDVLNVSRDDENVTADGISIANENSLSLKVTPRHDTIGLEANHSETQFCATVTARDLPEDDDSVRASVDIVVALDISGSMEGKKLELCKETLTLLLRELSARDNFGLVTFGSEARVEIPTRKLTKNNKRIAMAKIKSLGINGCTNLSGGIGLAAQELPSIESPNGVQTIFLLTDGLANRGVSDREGIIQLTKECLVLGKDQAPVAIHCFGYGSDHDTEMLRDISQVTEGGTYYFVENDSDVSSAFGDALGGVLSVVAQNAVLTFNASNKFGVRITSIMHDKAEKQEDGSFTVDIGDFYAEESRDVVCSVALATDLDFAGLKPVPHISVAMTYMDTINKKLAKYKAVEGSLLRPNGDEVSQMNKHVALQYIRIHTTNIIADAEKIAAAGNRKDAKTKIKAQIEYLTRESTTYGISDPLISQLMNELNLIFSGLSSQATWESGGACYMSSRIQVNMNQRSCESTTYGESTYCTSKKKSRSSKLRSSVREIISNP